MRIIKCDNGNIAMILKEVLDTSSKEIKANSVDASFEKHVPQFEMKDNLVRVFINHVMEDDHYIEWIMVDYGTEQIIKHFVPGDEPSMMVEYRKGMKAYGYCNKHSLWVSEEI